MEREERRGSKRLDLSWPIWVLQNEEELAHGRTDNISRSGAYFRSAVPSTVETGMTVSVRIGVPGDDAAATSLHTIAGDARVVRLKEEEESCGIALHFSEDLDPFSESSAGEP